MGKDYSTQGQLKSNRAKVLAVIFLLILLGVLIYILQDIVNKNVTLITMVAIVLLVIIIIPLALFVADTFLYEGE